MADIFDQIASQPKGDIFDQISYNSERTPADVNPQMNKAKEDASEGWVAHGLTDTAGQYLVNPLVQSINSVTPAINGINKIIGPSDDAIPQIKGPDMSNASPAARIVGDVAGGVTQGVAATAMGGGNPFLGYGALSGLSAYGQGKPVLPAVGMGELSAASQFMGGAAGSKLASVAAKPIGGMVAKYAPNIGSAIGMGAASAGGAAVTGGNPWEAGATGALFGSMNPMGGPKQMSAEDLDAKDSGEGASIYRNILNPGKGIINKVEIKSGGDINDSMKLAAKEALPINSIEGKLDNTAAIEKLKTSTSPLYDQQNQILASNPDKQFNLNDIASQVKSNLSSTIKNASDLQDAKKSVDNEIDAEILRHGTKNVNADGNVTYDPHVDGQTLNMIKQGMWGKSFDPMKPNANDSARAIGFAAKDAIEKAYPNDAIQENNAKIGQYLQLQKILEATHGQIVQGGKIGKYASQATGGLVGGLVGTHVPFLGEIAGPIAGYKTGEKVNQMINDPARITANWAKKRANFQVTNLPAISTRRPGIVSPQVVQGQNGRYQFSYGPNSTFYPNMVKGINSQNPPTVRSPLGLPSPKNVPYSPSQHVVMGEGSIKMPSPGNKNSIPMGQDRPIGLPSPRKVPYSSGQHVNIEPPNITQNPILAGRPEAPYEPGPEAIVTPRPGTPEYEKTFPQNKEGGPQSLLNPLKNIQQGSAISPLGLPTKTAMATAGALGIGSVFNPINSQAQTVKDPDRLKLNANQYIMKNEGWKGMPYMDTTGHKTVGYGFNMDGPASKYIPDDVKQGRRALTKEEGMSIFNKVYPNAVSNAQKFAGESWNNLSVNQQKSLIDMSYQMGSLNGFPKLKVAIQDGHYNTAAREILNSKYVKKDAPNRALQNSVLMQA